MTSEELAVDYSLPLAAVAEAIEYFKSKPPEIDGDIAREEAIMAASGQLDLDYRYHPQPKVLTSWSGHSVRASHPQNRERDGEMRDNREARVSRRHPPGDLEVQSESPSSKSVRMRRPPFTYRSLLRCRFEARSCFPAIFPATMQSAASGSSPSPIR